MNLFRRFPKYEIEGLKTYWQLFCLVSFGNWAFGVVKFSSKTLEGDTDAK